MADEQVKLLPCPFCGMVDYLEKPIYGPERKEMTGVTCPCCGARGPVEYDLQTAVNNWNRRVPAVGQSAPSEVVQILGEVLNEERSRIEKLMEGWRETSFTYKRYVHEIARVNAALAWLNSLTQEGATNGTHNNLGEHFNKLRDRVEKGKRDTLLQTIAALAIDSSISTAVRIEGLEMAQHLVGALLETLKEEQEEGNTK
jgi:Lar family restriction alleviation protein